MPFDLTVTLGGICLMVPDPSDGRLYGLMPPAPGDHGHGEAHIPVLTFRAGQLHRGGGASGKNPSHVPLENRALDLSGVTGDPPARGPLPPEVYSMDRLMGRGISRELLNGDGEGRLISRVVLAPGTVTGHQNGARWRMAGEGPRWMATSIRWSIPGVDRDSLEIELKPLAGGRAEERLELFPVPLGGRPTIDLYVFHTLRDDQPTSLPPVPTHDSMGRGQVADHFKYFYRLFGHPPVPVYEGEGDVSKNLDALDGLRPMCMSATATLE